MSNRQISQLSKDLIAARSLITNPKNWVQGRSRNDAGDAFCSVGALREAIYASLSLDISLDKHNRFLATQIALTKSIHKSHMVQIATFNDTHSHEQVLQKFDEAIAASIQKDNL